jgi:hypothetical protein
MREQFDQTHNRGQQFDLRQNPRQNKDPKVQEEERKNQCQEGEERATLTKGVQEASTAESGGKTESLKRKEVDPATEDTKEIPVVWKRCGRMGHKSEECYRPVICSKCKREGHVARVCTDLAPWECIAPFYGLAAPELGFHVIQDEEMGESSKESSNFALITTRDGSVSAKQVEGEFRAQAGPSSTWRWYAKKLAENKFQMKFPTAKKLKNLLSLMA